MDHARANLLPPKNNSIFLIPGTFYEEDGHKIFNVSPVFNRDGEMIAKAKKIYPWLPYEIDVDSSDEICVFNFENKGNIGIHICYDLWFPETARALAIARRCCCPPDNFLG